MTRKGLFTQGAMVLTERPLVADAVERALGSFSVVKRSPAEGEPNWASGYATWVVAMRPEVNGYVTVDVVGAPWPDDMGNPKDPAGRMLFGAWTMGMMGPLTWPGALARATQYAAAFGQKETAAAAQRHGAFVRVRSTYVLGAGDDAKVMPPDYDAGRELAFVTSVAHAVARLPGAICYFNPAGETLHTAAELDALFEACRAADVTPLPAWAAQRVVRLDDAPPWFVADVVGMGQLDAQDHEACFQRDRHAMGDVINFLRNTTSHVLRQGPVIRDGHTTDGPGGVWRAMEVEESLMHAPRRVLRWYPDDAAAALPPALRGVAGRAPRGPQAGGFLGRVKSLFGRG